MAFLGKSLVQSLRRASTLSRRRILSGPLVHSSWMVTKRQFSWEPLGAFHGVWSFLGEVFFNSLFMGCGCDKKSNQCERCNKIKQRKINFHKKLERRRNRSFKVYK